MIRLLADENFSGDIVRGLRQRNPALDILRVQDVGLMRTADAVILEWAAREGRILLTHDVGTMTHYAYERIRRGEPMPGVVAMSDRIPVGRAIDDILVLAECSFEGELEDQVRRVPL